MDNSPTRFASRTEMPRAVGDAPAQLTPDQASRLAVVAVVADLEYWARTVAVDGYVGLNDLTGTLDLIRETSGGEPADAA